MIARRSRAGHASTMATRNLSSLHKRRNYTDAQITVNHNNYSPLYRYIIQREISSFGRFGCSLYGRWHVDCQSSPVIVTDRVAKRNGRTLRSLDRTSAKGPPYLIGARRMFETSQMIDYWLIRDAEVARVARGVRRTSKSRCSLHPCRSLIFDV
jgi:hypothetical protein